jgi:hypothetical protein
LAVAPRVALITAFIAAIAARTVIAVARGQFLPPPQPAAAPPTDRATEPLPRLIFRGDVETAGSAPTLS